MSNPFAESWYGYADVDHPDLGALDIRAAVGTSTSPTSPGTKAVTGVGFQPSAVLDFWSLLASDANQIDLHGGIGAAVSGSNCSVGYYSKSNVTTSSTYLRHTSSAMITALNAATTFEEASLSSFDADGFTRAWNPASATAYILNHIALGGADAEFELTFHQMNATNADESFAHGLSGAPTGVLFFSTLNRTAPPNTSARLYYSIGAWSASSQFDAALFSQENVTTTVTRRRLSNVGVVTLLSPAVARQMAVASVDDTNVNCTYPNTISPLQFRFFMLAIRGAKVQTGTFDCNGSTDPLSISCTGITPKLFMPVMMLNGVGGINTVANNAVITIGASDGTNTVSCGVTDSNGVTTTNARRYQSSNSLVQYDISGIQGFNSTVSFDGESVVVDPSLCSANNGQGAYIIIGA